MQDPRSIVSLTAETQLSFSRIRVIIHQHPLPTLVHRSSERDLSCTGRDLVAAIKDVSGEGPAIQSVAGLANLLGESRWSRVHHLFEGAG